ncbi:MAG TPA: type IV pilus twitching motility protein PilT [Candidatus Saccharimonadales bacterium]|nr:type IV pilus twitching motility protein PilT [Candidatus Saccharimonadales bacterium]
MPRIDEIFKLIKEQGASDLHVAAGAPPMIRLNGELQPVEPEPLTADLVEDLLLEIMREEVRAEFQRENSVDFSYEVPGVVRMRANIYRHRDGLAAAFRMLPTQILTVEQLGLPPQVLQLTERTKGLVVVTGPPGTGKSTTLAAMIDHINATRHHHIITVEDPIEFVHRNKACLVNQREVGRHTPSFASALRAALREDPNVILVGEMRDLETMELAVTAAQTGTLVFGTLHTPSAAQTVDRIIDSFPVEQQQQIRSMLGDSLQGVVAQRLVKRADGRGRVAALEILICTPAIASHIRDRKTFQIPSVMQTSKREGMQLLDDALGALVRERVVALEDALAFASSREAVEHAAGLAGAGAAAPAAALRKAA